MIIVWINKRNWKTPGPIVNMAIHNAASFSELGYETHLCIGSGQPSDTDADMAAFYGIEKNEQFTIHRIPRYRFLNGSYSLSVFIYGYRLIKKLAQKDTVAVFTRESGFLFFLKRLCKSNPKVKGFYELHDLYADLSWVDDKTSGHRREWLYEHYFLPRINGLVCITKEQEKRYNAIFRSVPTCAFPLGTQPVGMQVSLEEKRARRTLIYVGHMHGEKGVDFLLSSARVLSKKKIRTLFLGGKDRQIPGFQNRAAELGVADHVQFVPFQPPEAMHRVMAREASLGVVMLKDTYYNRYLTCPVKALDYLSHGIPAIGSDIPSVHEVLEDAGTYIAADDMDGFIDAVLGILDNPERYADLSKRAMQRAEEISWSMRAKHLSAFAKAVSH